MTAKTCVPNLEATDWDAICLNCPLAECVETEPENSARYRDCPLRLAQRLQIEPERMRDIVESGTY